MPVKCVHCGSENRDGAKFCKTCGKLVMLYPPLAPVLYPPLAPAAATAPTPASLGQLAPNMFLYNRYAVTRLIGVGGMSAVYEAADNRLGRRRVAIKEIATATVADPGERQQTIAQFRQEAEMLARLNHPNLPRVTDYFGERDKQYLVMDFVEGQSLEKILQSQRGPLLEAAVVGWLLQLCDVLHYLHTRQPPVIFRDLKPSNIMLELDGKIKLIDFGIARIYKPGKSSDTAKYGTAGFAPPEQYGKGQTDARSDVFSLCATGYNLLTNYDPAQAPFNLPPLRQQNPSISEHLAQTLEKGMAMDTAKRWQSMPEVRAELQRLPHPGAPLAPTAPAPTAPALAPVSHQPSAVSHQPTQPRPPGPISPTTRLLQQMARMSSGQLVTTFSVLLILVVLFQVVIAPVIIAIFPGIRGNVEPLALVAPLAYALARRRGATFVVYVIVGILGGLLGLSVSPLTGAQTVSPLMLAAGAVASGVFIELWLLPLPRWVPEKSRQALWWVELVWLMAMTVIAIVLFHGFLFSIGWQTVASLALTGALFGIVGWFVGDTLQQYVTLRKRK